MAENILEKIIKKKVEKIENLKKTTKLETLIELIDKNNSFIDFKNKISEITIDPKELNINADKFENIVGNDAEFNAEKLINIFKGEDNDFSKAVCLNAAAGLIVNETHQNFADAYNDAREHILSNKVIKHLEKIQNG